MSARRPPVSETDAAIFRAAVGAVRPLRRGNPSPLPRPQPRPALWRGQPSPLLPLEELLAGGGAAVWHDPQAPLQFLQPGQDPALLRKLRRGHYPPQDELDLHHMSAATARRWLLDFIEEACHAGFRCVRIIHGKGLGSDWGGPVLKQMADQLLRRHDQVLAFCSASAGQGGTGAVLIWLRAQ